jgi:hypothetical protein
MMQDSWAADLDPLLKNPFLNGVLLEGVALASGATTINHKLGRKMQGWVITDLNGVASIYRSQPFNNLTLTLTSSAACTVNIYGF